MVSSFADWLCNVLVWSAIISFAVLFYDTFIARGFLASAATPVSAGVALGAVVVLSVALAEILGRAVSGRRVSGASARFPIGVIAWSLDLRRGARTTPFRRSSTRDRIRIIRSR